MPCEKAALYSSLRQYAKPAQIKAIDAIEQCDNMRQAAARAGVTTQNLAGLLRLLRWQKTVATGSGRKGDKR